MAAADLGLLMPPAEVQEFIVGQMPPSNLFIEEFFRPISKLSEARPERQAKDKKLLASLEKFDIDTIGEWKTLRWHRDGNRATASSRTPIVHKERATDLPAIWIQVPPLPNPFTPHTSLCPSFARALLHRGRRAHLGARAIFIGRYGDNKAEA